RSVEQSSMRMYSTLSKPIDCSTTDSIDFDKNFSPLYTGVMTVTAYSFCLEAGCRNTVYVLFFAFFNSKNFWIIFTSFLHQNRPILPHLLCIFHREIIQWVLGSGPSSH